MAARPFETAGLSNGDVATIGQAPYEHGEHVVQRCKIGQTIMFPKSCLGEGGGGGDDTWPMPLLQRGQCSPPRRELCHPSPFRLGRVPQ